MTPSPPIWVVDSSPLIVLAKVRRLDLLLAPGRRVLVPDIVAREIGAGPKGDPARLALAAGWGERVSDAQIPSALAEWRLDAGEEATLAAALTYPHSLAVLDDGDARRAAQALHIRMTGTLGIALQARQTGSITALAPLLHALQAVGLFLPRDAALHTLLQTIGEAWP